MTNPPHAVIVWANSDNLFVELPNLSGKQSHRLTLPLDKAGLSTLLEIVKARSSQSKLGEKGDPTQHQADRVIRYMKRLAKEYNGPVKKPRPKIEPDAEMSFAIRDIIRKAGLA